MPATFVALEPIALQNRNPNGIGNRTVVLVCLPIFFQNIYTNGQIIATAVFCDDGPTLFRPQFTDATGPFFLVFGQIFEFFTGYLVADILTEIWFDSSTLLTIETFIYLGFKVPSGHFQTGLEC
ncbi:MAG: hypothetical protein OJF47_003622 [Nitrospira sp.]|jgi:hypothetical protein|nr:MAG: hypothetical protein OJF47_003622 [Nitrospira sp.]